MKDAKGLVRKYQSIYRASSSAKHILQVYLGLDDYVAATVGISHGVDMNHMPLPLDILVAEPIHWAYNFDIAARARPVKSSVLIPHPLLLLADARGWVSPVQNSRALVIGPPPSEFNDRELLKHLGTLPSSSFDMLVKKRNDAKFDRSIEFWKAAGVGTVTAGDRDALFYDRLFDIFAGYESIVSPTLSSAVFFASALGLKVHLLTGYFCCCYEFDLDARDYGGLPRKATGLFVNEGHADTAMALSKNLLGAPLLRDRDEMRDHINAAYETLSWPVFVPAARGVPALARLYSEVARRTGATSFLNYGPLEAARRKIFGTKSSVSWNKADWIDIALNGVTENNFFSRPLRPSEAGARAGEGAEGP
jgi:hypothetical protein